MIPITWRRTLVGSCLAAAALAFAMEAPPRGAQAAGFAADEAEIRALMGQAAEAFNRHDAAGAAAFYASDADLVNVRGDHLKGRAAIERGLATAFATRYRAAHMKRGEVTIRFLRPDVALAHVTNEISEAALAPGATSSVHRELGLRVFVKDGGVWRIAALHNTPLALPAAGR